MSERKHEHQNASPSSSDYSLPVATKRPPLHNAVFNMDTEAITLLIEAGADKNMIYSTRTPLMCAIERGETGSWELNMIIDMLITEDNVNMVDYIGDSVLHMAVKAGAYKAIKRILDCPKVDLEIRNYEGRTPLKCCFWSYVVMDDDETMDDEIQCAQLLLDAGSDINTYDECGCNCLCDIIMREGKNPYARDNVVEFLIENGIDINGKNPVHKSSPLCHLEGTVNPGITRSFIEFNVDVNHACASTQTPLVIAIKAKNIESVVMLLLAGSRISNPYNLAPMLTELQNTDKDFLHRLVRMLKGSITDIDFDKAGTIFNNLISQPASLETMACWAVRASMASGQSFKDELYQIDEQIMPQSFKDLLSFKNFGDFLLPLPPINYDSSSDNGFERHWYSDSDNFSDYFESPSCD